MPNKTPESQQPLQAAAAAPRIYPPPPPDSRPLNPNIATLGYIFFCLNALFFGYLSIADPGGYNTLAREDSWVENLTAVWLFLSGLMLLATALAEGNLLRRCIYILAAIAFLLAAGEEISWGQRIIGFATPDFLLDLNAQREFNVHNFNKGISDRIYWEGTQVLCLLTCAAFFSRKDKLLGIPLPSILLVLGFLAMLSYRSNVQTDFMTFILQREKALLLLFAIFTLFSGQTKLFIIAAATAALIVALAYANYFSGADGGSVHEVREYLFCALCFFYALQLLLAHKPAQQKLATPFPAFTPPGRLILSLRHIKLWPVSNAEANSNPPDTRSIKNLMQTPFLVACLAITAASIALAPFAYFNDKASEKAIDAAIEERYQQIQSLTPNITATFNVYLIGKELTYLKDPCLPTDTEPRFLLHLIPADQKSLPSHRQQYNFDNLDFGANAFDQAKKIPTLNNKCLATIPLPNYPITKIQTGQYIPNQPPIWQKEIPVYSSPEAKNAAIAAIEERYQQIQSLTPNITANFNVYLIGKELTYLKEPCLPTDTEPLFFLHLTPADPKSLPPHRQQHGFDNLDFPGTAFDQAKKIPTLTNKCLATIPLPDYPITNIQTGQYTSVIGWIWQAEIPPSPAGPQTRAPATPAEIEERYQQIQSLTPDITATFNVYLTGKELTYLKDPCLPTDTEPRFLLHLIPADQKSLPPHRQQHGFDNLDFSAAAFTPAKKIPTLTNKCLATIPLPDYPITKIQTVQYIPNQPPIWQKEIPVHP